VLWLYQRAGEYLSCEVRTSIESPGYEIVIDRPDLVIREIYPSQHEAERRWEQLKAQLREDGWDEFSSWGSEAREHWWRRIGHGWSLTLAESLP
jgi:hypothetical protein